MTLLRRNPRRERRPRINTSTLAFPKGGDMAQATEIQEAAHPSREASAVIRAAVFERDLGICVSCHLDCESLENEWDAACKRDQSLHECNICGAISASSPCPECGSKSTTRATVNRWKFRKQLAELGFSATFADRYQGATLWAADHTLPVIEGGGGIGISNWRTLCLRCHDVATGELAKRRAFKRRGR